MLSPRNGAGTVLRAPGESKKAGRGGGRYADAGAPHKVGLCGDPGARVAVPARALGPSPRLARPRAEGSQARAPPPARGGDDPAISNTLEITQSLIV
jgi:hypothetical protein